MSPNLVFSFPKSNLHFFVFFLRSRICCVLSLCLLYMHLIVRFRGGSGVLRYICQTKKKCEIVVTLVNTYRFWFFLLHYLYLSYCACVCLEDGFFCRFLNVSRGTKSIFNWTSIIFRINSVFLSLFFSFSYGHIYTFLFEQKNSSES